MFGVPGIIILIVGIVIVLLLGAMLFAKNYVKVPPNQVAVFTGRGKPTTVNGGARFRMPIIERVDTMELTPFNVDVSIVDVYSSDSVPVNVTAVGLIRFGSTDEALATAVQRFLTSDRDSLQQQVKEILSGSLRNIVSQLTVEELNNNRDELTRRVLEEATSAFGPIGMQLDVLTIQSISDRVGYLEALGKKRTAEVKGAAIIGEADAKRESDIRSAQARQAGEVAQVEAERSIALARRELQIQQAAITEEVDAANARAAQAGPRADAEARRSVELAYVATQQQKTQAEIAVETQRAQKAREAQQADVVIPAEAARQAAVLRAQGERDAAVFAAEAEAKQQELSGNAEARSRIAQANALREELAAQASGEEATLKAKASGQRELNAAMRDMSPETLRFQLLPLILKVAPEIFEKANSPLGNIDKVVIVDNGGDSNGLTRFGSTAVDGMPAVLEKLESLTGINIQAFLTGLMGDTSSSSTATSGSTTSDAPPTPSPQPRIEDNYHGFNAKDGYTSSHQE